MSRQRLRHFPVGGQLLPSSERQHHSLLKSPLPTVNHQIISTRPNKFYFNQTKYKDGWRIKARQPFRLDAQAERAAFATFNLSRSWSTAGLSGYFDSASFSSFSVNT